MTASSPLDPGTSSGSRPDDRQHPTRDGHRDQSTPDDLPEQIQVRRGKRDRLLEAGRQPYPLAVPRTTGLAELRGRYDHLEAGQETQDVVSVAGRVVFQRNTGKLCFATLQDGDAGGTRVQVMLSLAEVGADSLADWKADVDLADYVSVTGRVISSKRGELSILASSWDLAAKAIRPLPVLHKEMSEEARVRQRYVDLIVRPGAREMVHVRAAVMRSLRETFHRQGFVEVETPMLQVMHGGAAARPFVTHSNAMGMDLYLRIAPELFLKRALVGGIDRVFEINRNFRNEGSDSSHSPEFAMLEFYQAYGDYESVADLTRQLVQNAATDALGSTQVILRDGSSYDLGGQWRTIEMYPAVSSALGQEITPTTPLADLRQIAERLELGVDPAISTPGKIVEEIFEHVMAQDLQAPTFVRGFPVDTSPLVKEDPNAPGTVQKWDLYVRGFELATGYSELNDPVVQRERFTEQAALAARGDEEAMRVDEDFLAAMEHGMPPAGGQGMGIDRLLMALTGAGIRETIMFPLVRPLA
ncbi:MAG: lysine--tRNA ligase [Actinomycetales bacterium]